MFSEFVLVQLISAVNKPKVERALLLHMYVLNFYANEHPDVLATIMKSCVRLVETTIEYHNKRVSSLVPKTLPNLGIAHYDHATCICCPVANLRQEMKDLFSGVNPPPYLPLPQPSSFIVYIPFLSLSLPSVSSFPRRI